MPLLIKKNRLKKHIKYRNRAYCYYLLFLQLNLSVTLSQKSLMIFSCLSKIWIKMFWTGKNVRLLILFSFFLLDAEKPHVNEIMKYHSVDSYFNIFAGFFYFDFWFIFSLLKKHSPTSFYCKIVKIKTLHGKKKEKK